MTILKLPYILLIKWKTTEVMYLFDLTTRKILHLQYKRSHTSGTYQINITRWRLSGSVFLTIFQIKEALCVVIKASLHDFLISEGITNCGLIWSLNAYQQQRLQVNTANCQEAKEITVVWFSHGCKIDLKQYNICFKILLQINLQVCNLHWVTVSPEVDFHHGQWTCVRVWVSLELV